MIRLVIAGVVPPGMRLRIYRRQEDGEHLTCLHDVPLEEGNALLARLERENFNFSDSFGVAEGSKCPPLTSVTEMRNRAVRPPLKPPEN